MTTSDRVRLVVFDWAGTTVDHGCFAPITPFVETLARLGIEISVADARRPMGLGKKDHLRELFRLSHVSSEFQRKHGRAWTEEDVARAYEAVFVPLQLECVDDRCELIPGLLDSVDFLRRRDIRIGTTTGYFREAALRTYGRARAQGYQSDCDVNPGDVSRGRPAPWMVFRIMESLEIYPPSVVVKIGDTPVDIAEGRNAGAWSVGVTQSSSNVGLTLAQWEALSPLEKDRLHEKTAGMLLAAGAHEVIRSVADLPGLIDRLETRLARGERP